MWLAGVVALTVFVLILLTGRLHLNHQAALREAALWDGWIEQIAQQHIAPPATEFTSTWEGIIVSSQPAWLNGMELQTSALWHHLSELDVDDFIGIAHNDLASRQPGVYVVKPQAGGWQFQFLPAQLLTAHGDDQQAILLLNAQGKVLFASAAPLMNLVLSKGQLGFQFTIHGGRLMLISRAKVHRLPGYSVAVGTDVSILLALTILGLIILITGSVTAHSRISPLLAGFKQFTREHGQALAQLKEVTKPVTPAKLRLLLSREDTTEPWFKELQAGHQALQRIATYALDISRLLGDKERQLEELNQLSPVGIVMLDTEGIILSANPRLCEILKYPKHQLEDSPWQSFIDPADQRRMQYMIEQQSRSEDPIRLKTKSADITFIFCTFVPRHDDEGHLLGVIGAITDVTALSRVTQNLEELEARWQFALESSGNGVWDWHIPTGKTFYSSQWCSLLGYADNELPPQIGEFIHRVHPEDINQCKTKMDHHLAGHATHYECEHRIRCKDGSFKWMLNRAKIVAWDENGKPARMIGTLADITDRKHNEARIQHLAYHDSLTDLPNRAFLQEELHFLLAQLRRSEAHSALLFLDIDHFKMINDSMGHLTGDEMLRQVAHRLKQNIREGDILVRLGGDEFVIVLGNPAEDLETISSRAQKVAQNILESFHHPFLLNQQNVVSGTSIGIVSFPTDGTTVDEILKHADTAMYEAKKNGRNRYHFYRAEMAAAIQRRLFLENALRNAIQNDELTLVYQPKVSLDTAEIIGAEALLRWQHEDEHISPGEFIPVAEDTGLIVPLGEWIMREACLQIKRWKQDPTLTKLRHLAINVSPLQFSQPEFAESTLLLLRELDVDPHWLEFELTEGVFMKNLEFSRNKMHTLKEHGIRFAMDDFGTGYSSLAYLKQLPLDVLKVDQAFVRDCIHDPNDASIVRTVLAMATGLGMEAVAEGVESEQHVAFLRDEGCQYFQGYYFSKPVSAAVLEAMARQ